jgi:3-hydroxyisobutyrate dehydrogenase-like beta-hydroxyacid dehydrogenase
MKVGFIGLGRMGSGMARNLLKARYDVTVYNRTPERSRALAVDGAKVAATVAEACRVDVLITMLANDAAVEDVVLGPDGVVSHLRAGALHISSSTISVALSRRLADAHRSKRQRFVSAPVFGRPDAAAAARLYVLVAGKPAAQEAAMPLLNALGQRIFVISEKPEAANLAKLCGSFLSASVIESLGDALALVSHGASTKYVAGREKGGRPKGDRSNLSSLRCQ